MSRREIFYVRTAVIVWIVVLTCLLGIYAARASRQPGRQRLRLQPELSSALRTARTCCKSASTRSTGATPAQPVTAAICIPCWSCACSTSRTRAKPHPTYNRIATQPVPPRLWALGA